MIQEGASSKELLNYQYQTKSVRPLHWHASARKFNCKFKYIYKPFNNSKSFKKWKGHLYDAIPTERVVGATLAVMIIVFGVCPYLQTNLYSGVGDRITASVLNRIQLSKVDTEEAPKVSQR